jgi:dihydroorotase
MTGANIIHGHVILPGADKAEPLHLYIEDGKIASVGKAAPIADHVDASGLIVAPGIIDFGVFKTDKPAFRFGGITRAALMPDQLPVHDDPATVRFAALKGKPDLWVHPLAAATQGLDGLRMAEIALMKEAGAIGVATGRKWISDSGVMLRIMQYCAALNLPVILHCEDSGVAGHAVATAGETATLLGLSSAPIVAETLAIARDLMLAEESGAHVHFRHLFLSDNAISDFRTFARLSPPLRSESDRLACIAAIADGTIDVIASGHDPRGPEDKRLPFSESAPGMAGAETLLALSLNLVRDNVISTGRMFELLASNPAKILGLNAGHIVEGQEADLILIDPDAPWQVDGDRMAALAGNTPFDRLPVQGRVRHMLKGGKVV